MRSHRPVGPQGDSVQVRAQWNRVKDAPRWISDSTDSFLRELSEILDIPQWQVLTRTPTFAPWPSDSEHRLALVESLVVNFDGDDYPEDGFRVHAFAGESRSPDVAVVAGAAQTGTRSPRQHATIGFSTQRVLPLDVTSLERIVEASASIWRPLTVCDWSTAAERHAPNRHGWQIPVGHRLWVSDDVGSFEVVPDGLSARRVADGMLLSSPAEWDAQEVYDGVMSALAANGLDELPH